MFLRGRSLRSWRDWRLSVRALFMANGREREPRSHCTSELERAARELGRSRVEFHSRLRRSRTRASPAFISTRLLPNSLAAPRFPLSAIRHKQSTRTRSPIPPATQARGVGMRESQGEGSGIRYFSFYQTHDDLISAG